MKIIDNIKTYIREKGKDEYQRKSFSRIVKFFIIMVILTLISRGTAGAVLPKIRLMEVSSNVIEDRIDISGKLSLSNHMAIEAEPNLKVNKILVEIGEKIEEGDPLLEYDKESVDRQVELLMAEVEKLEIQYKHLLTSDELNKQEIINAMDSFDDALEDKNMSKEKGDQAVAKGNETITDAKNKLENLEDKYNDDSKLKENAEKKLQSALETLEKSEDKLGPTDEELQQAEGEVTATKATLTGLKDALVPLENDLSNKKSDLDVKEQALKELKEAEVPNPEAIEAAETAVATAKNNLNQSQEAYNIKNEKIIAATDAVKNAENKLKVLQPETIDQELVKARQEVAEARALVNSYDNKKESGKSSIEEAKQSIEGSNEGLEDIKSLEKQQQILQDRGVESAKKAMDSTNYSYAQLEKKAKEQQEVAVADAKILSIGLEDKKEELNKLKEIQKEDYIQLSKQNGILYNWNVKEREPSVEVAGIITDESKGFQFEFQVSEQEIETIKHGMEVIITENFTETLATITTIGEQNIDETYTIVAKVEEGIRKEGSANGYIKISEQEFATCVPSSAIRQDNNGSFVFAVEERNTILGMENIAYRINVTVEETRGGLAAVSGALYERSTVVSYSNKPLREGDRVRLEP